MERRPSADMMAGMAEAFMSDWTSDVFRQRCVVQIDSVRSQANPRIDSDDPVEKFLAERTPEVLEEFVFSKSKSREDYVSLIADMMIMLRQHAGKPAVNRELLEQAGVNGVNGDQSGSGAGI